jgi:hypothetical protein
MRKYTALWALAAVGVLMHLAGIGVDAYLHGRDDTLAAREGIFTLGNPGHVLIFAGFSLTAASLMGIALVWLNTKRVGGDGPVARILRTATLPAMALAAAGTVWTLSLGEGTATHTDSHDEAVAHFDLPAGPPGAVVAVANDGNGHTGTASTGASAASPMGEAEGHHGKEIPVTPDQLQAAADFYARVKVSAVQFESVKDAMALGYIQVTQDLPAIAAHFYHPIWSRDGQLMNPERPEVLLYTKRMDGNWRLVGFMFTEEKVNETPPSFFGPLDAWHRHENLCFTAGAGVSAKPNKEACSGGVFTAVTAWQMHVWTAPGATTGAFAHDFPPISPGRFPGATRTAAQDVLVRAP